MKKEKKTMLGYLESLTDIYNQQNIIEEVLEIKKRLELAGASDLLDKIVYMPEVPVFGVNKEFVLGEVIGIRVAFLVGVGNDNL